MKKWKLWSQALFLEGLVLIGTGFGWGLGARAGTSLMPVFVLVSIGFLGLMASLILWRWMSKALAAQNAYPTVIDIAASERALFVHKSQPPLIESGDYRLEHVLLRGGQSLTGLKPPLILEHGIGANIEVLLGDRVLNLGPKHIVRVGARAGVSRVDLHLAHGQEESLLLIHFLSSNEGLE